MPSTSEALPSSLHDYLSLGEVEHGFLLRSENITSSSLAIDGKHGKTKANITKLPSSQSQEAQEIERLPTVLRLLSSTRPLVSLSIYGDENSDEDDGNIDAKEDDNHQDHHSKEDVQKVAAAEDKDKDALVHRTVRHLEHVAAIHSAAEGVDVVTCYLVPAMTRKLSKVPPLTKAKNGNQHWDTTELLEVARNPRGKPIPRKRAKLEGELQAEVSSKDKSNEEEDEASSEDEVEVSKTLDEDGTVTKKRKKTALNSDSRRTSLEVAAEDSQEATVIKIISELTTLVAKSLEPISSFDGDCRSDYNPKDDHHNNEYPENSQNDEKETNTGDDPSSQQHKGKFALTLDDTIIGETGRDGPGSAMELDLGSTVAAIMHHAPVLQSRHVANALCRSSVPQLGTLMTRIGANAPSTIPSLVRGSIQAYKMAIHREHTSISESAKKGVKALAGLSLREKCRIARKLDNENIMWDVQLALAIEDPISDDCYAARLLLCQLSQDINCHDSHGYTNSAALSAHTLSRRQDAGEDASEDFQDFESERQAKEEPSLSSLLAKQPNLLSQCLDFLSHQIDTIAKFNRLSPGRLLLLLKAYNILLLVDWPLTIAANKSVWRSCDRMVLALKNISERILDWMVEREAPEQSTPESDIDPILEHFLCALLMSIARVLKVQNDSIELCQELFILIREIPNQSQRIKSFQSAIEALISNDSHFALYGHCAHLFSSRFSVKADSLSAHFEKQLKEVCSLLRIGIEKSTSIPMESELGCLNTTLSSMLIRMEYETLASGFVDDIQNALRVLVVSQTSNIGSITKHYDTIARFVSKATQCLVGTDKLLVPLVFISQLEYGSPCLFLEDDSDEGRATLMNYLLRLLHAFEWYSLKPESPFAFEPLVLPLRKAFMSIHPKSFIRKRFLELAGSSRCVLSHFQNNTSGLSTSAQNQFSRHTTLATLSTDLYSLIVGSDDDQNASGAEALFLWAKPLLSDAEICTTVCSALLAHPHQPKPVFSFYSLCQDPLIILKCKTRIWRRRGLRHIALATLTVLLDLNTQLVLRKSPLVKSAKEYLASRDVAIVRCLLVCIVGIDPAIASIQCAMTCNLIRSCISTHDGLVAALVKQGISEQSLDWMVDNIPEIMNDSSELLQLLSVRSSLTTAERLVAADAIFRIAVVHRQKDEEIAASMAYEALVQIVDSFFLVVGPVGVPVNALMVDDSGVNVTQMARKAAFRMLQALTKVRYKSALWKECGIVLQKLAVACKTENNAPGVGGSRKVILKEIFDLVMRATTSMAIAGH